MKYQYSNHTIPALYLDVNVSKFKTDKLITHKAKIDTGADITRLPISLQSHLDLNPFSENTIGYGNDTTENVITYLAVISWDNYKIPAEVYFRNKDYILLGRNVLNYLVLHCDGINKNFWFDECK